MKPRRLAVVRNKYLCFSLWLKFKSSSKGNAYHHVVWNTVIVLLGFFLSKTDSKMVYIAIRSATASSGESVEIIGMKSTYTWMSPIMGTSVGYGVSGS